MKKLLPCAFAQFTVAQYVAATLLTAFLFVMILPVGVHAEAEGTTLRKGGRVQVSGTGGVGLWVQSGPALTFAGQVVLAEGQVVNVLSGPIRNDGYDWYKITGYDSLGSSGWSAGRWLLPTSRKSIAPPTVSSPTSRSGFRTITLPVLMYHNVGYGWNRYAVTISAFREQLNWLQNNGYTTVTLPQVYDYMYEGGKLPSKPVVLTFDDGWASQWNAVLELNARGMKGVFFVMGGSIGLSDVQLRRMAGWGHEIEAHSLTHPDLPQLSDGQLYNEVAGSKKTLESRLGVPIHFFAYPYGSYNGRVIDAVAAAGYRGGIAAWGGGYWTPDQRWTEPRIEISGFASLQEFAYLVRSATE